MTTLPFAITIVAPYFLLNITQSSPLCEEIIFHVIAEQQKGNQRSSARATFPIRAYKEADLALKE
jgi:hypothetical protein